MITWDFNPDIFQLGPFTIRWYGLLFAASFLIGFQIMKKIFQNERLPEKDLNDLFWYALIATIVGARLGHCLFYEPVYYLSNPLELFKTWKGGLASHGAALGLLTALYIYSKKKKGQPFLWLLDRVVISIGPAAALIRFGNLLNSEIIGKPTAANWGFIFTSVDNIPRHPSQLYEAIFYLVVFVVIFAIYWKTKGKFLHGLTFSIFLIGVFGFRFFVEFTKEIQAPIEQGLSLNLGQILSIPLVLVGIVVLIRSLQKYKKIKV